MKSALYPKNVSIQPQNKIPGNPLEEEEEFSSFTSEEEEKIS